jgi:hypothetical protein
MAARKKTRRINLLGSMGAQVWPLCCFSRLFILSSISSLVFRSCSLFSFTPLNSHLTKRTKGALPPRSLLLAFVFFLVSFGERCGWRVWLWQYLC